MTNAGLKHNTPGLHEPTSCLNLSIQRTVRRGTINTNQVCFVCFAILQITREGKNELQEKQCIHLSYVNHSKQEQNPSNYVLARKADLKMDLITSKSFTGARCPRTMPAPTILFLCTENRIGSWEYKSKSTALFHTQHLPPLLHMESLSLPRSTTSRSEKKFKTIFPSFLNFSLYKLQTWNSTYLQLRTKMLNVTFKATPDRIPSKTLKKPGGRTAMRKIPPPFLV